MHFSDIGRCISLISHLKALTRAVNTRMHDISKISQDQAAFKAQTTYKTMKSYLWAICAQAYDESQG